MKKKHQKYKKKKTYFSLEHTTKLLLAISQTSLAVYAEAPYALIGGANSSSEGYASLVSSTGALTPLSVLSTTSQIDSVDLNSSGNGIIGGGGSDGAYAALVSPSGSLMELVLSLPSGSITSNAINTSGNGIVGGNDGVGNMYWALISKEGAVNPISTPISGFIRSVDINDAGLSLIGGEGSSLPYAAYVSSGGVVTEIDTSPLSGGSFRVAINSSGKGIIGGVSTLGAYAAYTNPGSSTPTVLSPIPPGTSSSIQAVAINESGIGLIGGYDSSTNIYAGYANADGVITPLFDTLEAGQVLSVALNNSGAGIIGGETSSNFYASLVQPDGTLIPLFTSPVTGYIESVAISDSGVALIGGTTGPDGYTALVAPNGTLTPLDMTGVNFIKSVSLKGSSSILSEATPQSVGPYLSSFYTQLAASATLQPRFLRQKKNGSSEQKTSYAHDLRNQLAYNTDKAFPIESGIQQRKNSLWISPFGNYVKLSQQNSIPSYTNTIGGAVLGYDHHESNYLIGTSVAYAFNYIDYAESLGHSKLQEEMISLYGGYYLDHFWFDAALWGGLYQLSNTRSTLEFINSKSSTHGWILSPHIEMASPWTLDQNKRFFIEPFFMIDWVNSWQNHYTETGDSGLNLIVPDTYGSLLQSEIGLRFYEIFEYRWGDFSLEEKLSYVNQAPFDNNSVTTSFVGSASSFPIAVASNKVENLGSAQLMGTFLPQKKSYPFFGFNLQVTANGNYQSYYGSLFTGMDF